MKYAVLNYRDRQQALKEAMAHRIGKVVYVMEVFDTKEEAIKNRGSSSSKSYRLPVGVLDEVELLPSAYYKGKLVEVEY